MGEKESIEVRITYETLFDMLRAEKGRHELQRLPKTFVSDIISYLNGKRKILEESKTKSGLFVLEEKERAEKQLENIKKILIELYERREKKIISLAIDKSRIKSDIVDTTLLLEEEKEMFDKLVDILDNQRKSLLISVLQGKALDSKELEETKIWEKEVELAENREVKEKEQEMLKEPTTIEKGVEKEVKTEKLVRFIHAVPRFIGKELETYGPFEEEDISKLPAEISDVLIEKGRAEEIEEN